MRLYETVFIINPDIDETETNDIVERVKNTVESNEGKILKVDVWGKRRLAYPIRRHNDGYYVVLVFESEPDAVHQLKAFYRVTEPIIRDMVVHLEEGRVALSEVAASAETKSDKEPPDSELEDVGDDNEDQSTAVDETLDEL